MAAAPQRPQPRTLSDLFPSRLSAKRPHWTQATKQNNCLWCEDEIYEGEKIAILGKEVYCAQCGQDPSIMGISASSYSIEKTSRLL